MPNVKTSLFFWFGLLVACAPKPDQSIILAVQKAQEVEALEQKVFEHLVFSDPEPINLGVTFKLKLKDQLGRSWMFKGGDQSQDGAVAIYRVYRQFGIDTPEIHYKELTLNKTPVNGTIQVFIEGAQSSRNMGVYSAPFQAKDNLEYLVKNHLLSWLTGNLHVHPDQFLVVPGAEMEKLIRIDNSVEWYLVNQRPIEHDYETPLLWERGRKGYTSLWRSYFSKMINLDLQKAYEFASFINGFPNDIYEGFFSTGIRNGLKNFANSSEEFIISSAPEVYKESRKEDFEKMLQWRKRNIKRLAADFYQKMYRFRGEERPLSEEFDSSKVSKEILAQLEKRKTRLLADLESLQQLEEKNQLVQKPIEGCFSVAVHEILKAFFGAAKRNPIIYSTEKFIDGKISELRSGLDRATLKGERAAFDSAIEVLVSLKKDCKKGGFKECDHSESRRMESRPKSICVGKKKSVF